MTTTQIVFSVIGTEMLIGLAAMIAAIKIGKKKPA